jgi:hypothetical protein
MNLYFLSVLGSCKPQRRESVRDFKLPNNKTEFSCVNSQPCFCMKNGVTKIISSSDWSGYITIFYQGSKLIYYRFPGRIVVEDKKGKFKAIKEEDKFVKENYLGRLILIFFS